MLSVKTGGAFRCELFYDPAVLRSADILCKTYQVVCPPQKKQNQVNTVTHIDYAI